MNRRAAGALSVKTLVREVADMQPGGQAEAPAVGCSDARTRRKCICAYTHKRFPMTRWNLVIADDTDRHVRSYLARTGGKKGDLSRFVDRAVRQAVFWETVESIWERNRDLSSEDAQRLADESVAEFRADRS